MGKRNFTVVEGDGSEWGTFGATEPRRAAMKAVNKNHKVGATGNISIRERGTDKIRTYSFEVVSIPAAEGAPAWIPKQTKAARVKYVSTYRKEA